MATTTRLANWHPFCLVHRMTLTEEFEEGVRAVERKIDQADKALARSVHGDREPAEGR